MLSKSIVRAGLCAALLFGGQAAGADDLRNFFTDLVVPIDAAFSATVDGPGADDPTTDVAVLLSVYTPGAALENLSNAAFSQFQNFPVGSTVAGFTYEFDPALAIFVRSTQGLGPIVAERAQTNGKGKLNVSFAYSRISFDVFEGDDLDDLDVNLDGTEPAVLGAGDSIAVIFPSASGNDLGLESISVTTSRDLPIGPGETLDFTLDVNSSNGSVVGFEDGLLLDFPDPVPVELFGDYSITPNLADVSLDAQIDMDLFALFGSFGVTDWLDVGIVVPILRIDLHGKVTSSNFFSTADFIDDRILVSQTRVDEDDETKTGLGDVILRGKARFFESDYGDLAARMDVSLPTGNEDDLMGRGNAAVLQQIVASETFFGRLSPHVNAGFFFDLGDSDQNQFRYVVGSDLMLHERVTVAADIVGSHDLKPDDIGDDQVGVSAGMKFNPWSRLVISGNALVRLNSEGLRADLIPSGSIEYTFF